MGDIEEIFVQNALLTEPDYRTRILVDASVLRECRVAHQDESLDWQGLNPL